MGKPRIRKRSQLCPLCGGPPDEYWYEPDEEQIMWGYPPLFQMCAHDCVSFLEIGKGHCRPDW
jgi:hypothetical protein